MANLYEGSQQWAKRPNDEKFWTLPEARVQSKAWADSAIVAPQVFYRDLRTEARDGEVVLIGKKEIPSRLIHWSFGQLAGRVGAPASYLRSLPATLAAQNLNHGLSRVDERDGERAANILMHKNSGYIVRAFTSDVYERVWNHEVLVRLERLLEQGWRVPPARPANDDPRARPATAADILDTRGGGGGLSVNIGDMIAPAGIYVSDHDMFVFMVNENYRLEDGTDGGLSRGVFVKNSEVGAASLVITRFMYRHVCGNHIVWDAEDVIDIRLRHVGAVFQRFGQQLRMELEAVKRGTSDDQAKINRAKGFLLGKDKDEVLDKLFGMKVASRKDLDRAFEAADQHYLTDGNPTSAWGMAQGLTRISQEEVYQDARDTMDRAAGKVLRMAF